MLKKGDLPEVLKQYHTKNDVSKFIEEDTLNVVFDILWNTVVNN